MNNEAKRNRSLSKRKFISPENQSYWAGVMRRFAKNKLALISLVILVVIILACIFVPIFSPYRVETTSVENYRLPPSSTHWFGTDDIGRDLFTRLFFGGRISLGVALAVVALECLIGIVLGSIAGFYGGVVDAIIMRICDIFMCFPFLMICITMAAIYGNSIPNLIMVLALLSWPGIAKIVRGQILTLRDLEYMEACEALGISDFRRIFKHLFPNILAYVIVYATLGMASVILTETSLSFLGVGVSPPTPTWGNLIQAARDRLIMEQKWWYWVPPGISILLSVMCFNLLGDGLRDAIDPKMKR